MFVEGVVLRMSASLISLISCMVFFAYVFSKSFISSPLVRRMLLGLGLIRNEPYSRPFFWSKVSIRLLTYLQFSLFAVSISHVYGFYTFYFDSVKNEIHSPFCYLQSIQTQYFLWSGFMWSLIISLWLIYSVVLRRKYSLKLEIGVHIACWGIPAIFTFIPFIGLTYGKSGNWCWISSRTKIGAIWQLLSFYVPLWCIIFLLFLSYLVTMLYVRKTLNDLGKYLSFRQKKEVRRTRIRTYMKLVLYPATLMVVWIFPTINRVYEIITGGRSQILTNIHSFSSPIHGALNTMVFFLNPFLICKYCRICKLINTQNKSMSSDVESDDSESEDNEGETSHSFFEEITDDDRETTDDERETKEPIIQESIDDDLNTNITSESETNHHVCAEETPETDQSNHAD